ncbi:hypothetical protein ACFY2R_29405 [Micromonospora olivasterospora]|uniref:Uncharacterized protein n=1 Tax=Micromonospora olivasterospora TaxID=1880 RepID=A0A562IGT1_MICOL|nr:hypothetical protein [Micromonospora olivasterospora]TWH70241.1 hypothetical protein JD77_05262 [Micromonospora olivasterospora]
MAKTVRWVQYEAAVFVRVEADENGWDTEITKVVTANDADELHLARDDRGHFRVYDENFEPVNDDLRLDGIRETHHPGQRTRRRPHQRPQMGGPRGAGPLYRPGAPRGRPPQPHSLRRTRQRKLRPLTLTGAPG